MLLLKLLGRRGLEGFVRPQELLYKADDTPDGGGARLCPVCRLVVTPGFVV